jgi:putative nucleotidyltransferase with HDIG domain
MPARLRLSVTEPIAEPLRAGVARQAVEELARLAGADLELEFLSAAAALGQDGPGVTIAYRGQRYGLVSCSPNGAAPAAAETAARTTATLVESLLDRELAVNDLADALMSTYEELNLLYTLLPHIATKVEAGEIGEVLVAETARVLRCRRVSLMVLDDSRTRYRVLASRGLPPGVKHQSFPVGESVAAAALRGSGLMVVNDISQRPDLARMSRGQYDTDSFAVVTVPLQARGQALGFITATEREGGSEFTTHEVKLLEGLSSMGASALLNCQLHADVSKQMISTIHALASAVDAKDEYTHDHAGRVANLCVATARWMGIIDPVTLREVQLAGLLHDIGKIGIPDAILSKPAQLTPEEFAKMREHVHIGPRIVEQVPGLQNVARAIRHHHERHDGLGYPSGLSGNDIPLPSALISVADAYDALTSDRPYRKAGTASDALRELDRCRGTQLRPDVVDAFTAMMTQEEGLDPASLSTSQKLAQPAGLS